MTAPSRLCLFGILTGAAIMPASAADAPPPPAAYLAPVQPLSIVSEIRIGGAVQDPGSAEGKLPGFSKANVNGEILFAKPILSADPFWQAFVPRPTVGGSYNTGGRTSYAYLGATWTLEVFPETFNRRVFLDGFFGGVAHNGWTGPKAETPYGFNTLGCSPMFREAAALGFRITEHWSIMATIEHMSNAGLCANNRGLTNYGGKIGYTF
ncbi:iron acquisition and metabolism [Methylobacterium phyllosphaerae]|uniref:Iron acquisition and metabolism n=1 Tax=Methylobacterium phyllosphaerae TaxID=418223 RepID=A0AAE8HTN4_9HYPH|nr:iron acquisition and metabolism [Methylobacterium phyllosphaerae]SFH15407.1 Lipid A 3-O-deacylase (PagL) [Methylobacterium phyllosphaerae]